MSKPRQSTVHRTIPPKEWELKREQERISYPIDHCGPVQMDWRTRGTYSAKDLDYRGRLKSK